MRQKFWTLALACGLLPLLARASATYFAPTLQYYDWIFASSGSQGYNHSTTNSLPPGMSIQANSDDSVSVNLVANATLYAGPSFEYNIGVAYLEYRSPTSSSIGSSGNGEAILTRILSAYASTSTLGAQTSGNAECENGVHASALSSNPVTDSEGSGGPRTEKLRVKVENSISKSNGSSTYFPVNVDVGAFSSLASVIAPTSNSKADVVFASASGTVKLYPAKARITATDPGEVSRLGSEFRSQTYFKVDRSDNVLENLNVCAKSPSGKITFSGLGYPNITLTIKLIQPGFLQQTSTRQVLNEQLDSPLAVELVFGDANGDRAINSTDLSIITSYLGVSSTDAAWNSVIPNTAVLGGQLPIRVRDLDENLDGVINQSDLSKAQGNQGRTLL